MVGRLEQRSYDDKDGVKRSITEVVADTVSVDTKGLESIERRTKQTGDSSAANSGSAQSSGQRRAKPMTTSSATKLMETADEPF